MYAQEIRYLARYDEWRIAVIVLQRRVVATNLARVLVLSGLVLPAKASCVEIVGRPAADLPEYKVVFLEGLPQHLLPSGDDDNTGPKSEGSRVPHPVKPLLTVMMPGLTRNEALEHPDRTSRSRRFGHPRAARQSEACADWTGRGRCLRFR